ncbi:MFS transporter [Brevibacillus marinus]|uniref:MFS transporter n=1 Tax=Brevibacillus marinus TaxID=2496837 RepID=UPI000F8378F6|nr:MFS transporter [Brevibacillus marinus]
MIDIDSRVERIPDNRYNKRLLVTSGLGYTFDAMDMAIIAFVLPVVMGLWNLTSAETGLLGSSVLIGYFLGALFAGYFGDRFGRKKVIVWTLVIYSVATVFSAFATNWGQFFWLRVIAGIGTGGESAIIAPFLSELISSKYRGKYVGALSGFFSFGYVGAAVLAYFVIPISEYGWRIALLITALPIFLVIYWRRALPESPRWLESKGKLKEADQVMTEIERKVEQHIGRKLPEPTPKQAKQVVNEKGNFLTLWKKPFVKSTVMLWILWFSIVFAYYGFFTWIPTLLFQQGFAISKSFLFSIIMYLAQIPGYFTGAFLNDVIGRKNVIIAYLGLGAVSAVFMSQAESSAAILISGFFMSLFMTGTYAGIYAYTPEQYPTMVRSTGTGSASSFGRIGGLLAPIFIGYMYPIYGFLGVFLMTTGILVLGMLAVIILGEETKFKSLDQITSEKFTRA